MNAQVRNLELHLRGDDVARLQAELRQLDLPITDPQGFFGTTTLQAVQRFQSEHRVAVSGVVDARTARLIGQAVAALPRKGWQVQGRLLHADGSALASARVRAFERHLRRETRLGEATPDANGHYRIDYAVPDSGSLGLVVRAFDATGNEIAASAPICNVAPVETVDLVAGNAPLRGPPLFARLQVALRGPLAAERVAAADLSETDVDWLACRHGVDAVALARFADAARLARDASLANEHEAVFGLLMQAMPPRLEALIAQSPASLSQALARAVEGNQVAADLSARVPQFIEALQAVIVRLALREPTPDRPSFALLFELAGTPRAQRERVLDDYLHRPGSVADFWQAQRDRLGDEGVQALQRVVQLSALTLNHEPLLRQLMRMHAQGELEADAQGLARLSRDDWQRLLQRSPDGSRVGAPAFLGTDETRRSATYATFLARYVEAAAPTRVLAARLAQDPPGAAAAGLAFLQRHADLDFRAQRVGDYLREHPETLDDDTDADATRRSLQAMQRLFDLAPAFDKYRAVQLLDQGIDSATRIRRLGETAFVERAAATLGGAAEARAVYAKAALKADTALLLLSQTAYMNPTAVAVLPPQLLVPDLPDLEDLFGSLDGCRCLHCESVYGPAAYLVDLLHFLMNCRSRRSGHSALDELFARRGDIGEIDLNCDNAQIALPYVDLVLEILENAVTADSDFPYQTEGVAVDLLASPARLNPAAYDRVADEIYPWSLPFDLWAQTARTYLDHLGVPRHQLMQRFRADADTAADVAAEYLRLSAVDRAVLIGPSPAPARAYWGFAQQAGFTAMAQSANVATLLERSRLSYDELVAVLDVRFVDPSGRLRIRFAGADCDLADAAVANLSQAALGRLHRFMRLQRKLGWRIDQLGDALQVLAISDLDAQALLRIADVERLRRRLDVPLRTALAWWSARIDTHGTPASPSLYADVFLDPSANRPEAEVFALNAARTELAHAAQALISDNLPAVHAALGISAAELSLLLPGLPDDRLDLANLTRLQRTTSLAQATGMGVADHLVLRALSGIEPVGPAAATAQTLRFVEAAQFVQRSGIGLPLLDYLLRHRFAANASFAPSDTEIGAFLLGLRDTLRAIDLQFALAPPGVDAGGPEFVADPDGTRTAHQLAALMSEGDVGRALALIRQDEANTPADAQAFLQSRFAAFIDVDEAVERLVGPGSLSEPAARFNYVLAALLAHLRATARRERLFAAVGEAFDAGALAVATLLGDALRSPGDAARTVLDEWLDADFIASADAAGPVERDDFGVQFACYERLSKLLQLTRLLGIGEAHLDWVVREGPAIGWVDVASLPLAAADDAQDAFTALQAMALAIEAGAGLPGGLDDFFALLRRPGAAGVTRSTFLDELALRSGWNRSDIEFIAGAPLLGLAWPQGFRGGALLADMAACFGQLKRLGVAASTAQSWAALTLDATAASTIVQAARAKYPDKDTWLAVARPLRDALREQQRAALVDLLVRERGVDSPAQLYGHFLVDVEMDPCMLSSRIVLATASVQLFVQRCLLNLEPQVAPSAIDAAQWAWMKNYRVWEANRKVFLYPENWIEPELRDDKSPFFEALEQGLLQDEVDAATVEREYLKYLEALDQVANLEICGLHVGKWGLRSNVVHAFARTRNTPRRYFYRRWDRASWTAWEPLEAGIEGDHLVPVMWNGRLNLFWPTFMEKADQPAALDPDVPAAPQKYYEIKLAWSEYREGAWTPKRVTDEAIDTSILFGLFGPSQLLPLHEAARDHSFVSSTRSDGSIEIGALLRVTGGDPDVDANELTLTSAFRLSEIGDIETADAVETAHREWAPSRRFPATRLFRNKIREQRGHVGFSVHTTASSQFGADIAVVLDRSPGRFSVVYPQDERPFFCRLPFFYQDRSRSFFIVPDGRYLLDDGAGPGMFGADLALPAPATHAPANAAPALDLSDRVASFHLNAAIAAGATAPAAASAAMLPGHWEATTFDFHGHSHAFVRLLIGQLNRYGIDGMLKPDARMEPSVAGAFETLRRQALFRPYFIADYAPNPDVVESVRDLAPGLLGLAQAATLQPRDDFDFSFGGAYSIYNWELFFHAPFLIAKRLSANRRFEDAHRWFNYLFEPTEAGQSEAQDPALRVWNVKPFVEHGQGRTIERLMLLLRSSGLTTAERKQRIELNDQIEAWRANPFNPHLIARMRIQPYMMAVVMAYLDNLVAWADELFRRDTMESVNEASQLYVLAAEILGERPREIAAHEGTRRTIGGQVVTNFNQLRDHLDAFSNALVELEGIVQPGAADQGVSNSGGLLHAGDFAVATPSVGPTLELELASAVPSLIGPTLFFCIPRNDKLAGYWDTVADRLFKIRHCMNIEGAVRQLPLFQPPIDPALLVKAAASGVDIGSALADLGAPLPNYRFATLLQKARDMSASVKSLGGAMLATLEKKDGEALSLLRARHETELLAAVRAIRERSVDEARAQLDALLAARSTVSSRRTFFATREHTSAKERLHQKKLENAFALQTTSQALELLVGALALIPQFDVGVSGAFGTPVVKVEVGGVQLSTAVQVASRALQLAGSVETYRANKASIEAGYDRRQEDWDFQSDAAGLELSQIDKQATAARIRFAIAEQELKNHDRQVAASEQVQAFLRDKYTNQELYGWMIAELSALRLQSFQLALDLAKRAERCFRHELGLQSSAYISAGHWDSLRKGLLAGEKLELDLQRLEARYLEQHRREYELTRHVSLRQLDPLALLSLKATAACEFVIPEWLFDLDGPGHYLRRIKSVAISMPCVAGPYASVNCTASLLSSSVRTSPLLAGGYAREGEDAARFIDIFGNVQSVVTSGGNNDSGLFEPSLRDERYLPFEGSGAIGRWRLSLPRDFAQFDYGTIADAIVHLRYTARDGGEPLRQAAIANLAETLGAANDAAPSLLLSLRNDYPSEWQRFLNGDTLTIELGRDRLSYIAQGRAIQVQSVALVLLGDGPPIASALSPQQIGLDTMPHFAGAEPTQLPLQFADPGPIERTPQADPFLLVRYAIE